MNNNPVSGNFKLPRDRATLDAITILEIVQDASPDVARSEHAYLQTVSRVAEFLRERELELETNLVQQLTPND